MEFTITYHCKFELKNNSNYKFTDKGDCFNSKTGRKIKMILKGSTKGFVIDGRFKSVAILRGDLIKIRNIKTPF